MGWSQVHHKRLSNHINPSHGLKTRRKKCVDTRHPYKTTLDKPTIVTPTHCLNQPTSLPSRRLHRNAFHQTYARPRNTSAPHACTNALALPPHIRGTYPSENSCQSSSCSLLRNDVELCNYGNQSHGGGKNCELVRWRYYGIKKDVRVRTNNRNQMGHLVMRSSRLQTSPDREASEMNCGW